MANLARTAFFTALVVLNSTALYAYGIPWWDHSLSQSAEHDIDAPWARKAPDPYANKDSLLVQASYKERWVKSSIYRYPQAIRKAKKVLREWGRNPDNLELNGKTYEYEIIVSESMNFISIIFRPKGLAGSEQHVEIRMAKKGLIVLSILPGV